MDINDQIEKYLREGKIEDIGGHIGRLLYKRYKSSQDVQDKIDTVFLVNVLILSLITKDRNLMTKSKTKL